MRFVEEVIASTETDTNQWFLMPDPPGEDHPFISVWRSLRTGVVRPYVATNSVWYVDLEQRTVVLKRIFPLGTEDAFYTHEGARREVYLERPMWDSEGPNNLRRDTRPDA